jgi:NADPH-dependent 2,4-dienoyl-CoA reductase/sulfur reductase-like enzyme/rhodanese-related sulfurtransferase
MRVIIVGGVAGGASAAARLRRLDESAEIVVIERGEHVSFANCGLPYHIAGVIERREEILLQTPGGMKRRFEIEARTRQEVVGIDRASKTVRIRRLVDGEIYTDRYDVLILSPGAAPSVPPIPGVKHDKVIPLRTIPDMDRIEQLVARGAHAVIVGGGYIGIEVAEALVARGLRVTVVEMLPQVLTFLDSDLAALAASELRRHGVRLELGQKLTAIEPASDKLIARLASGAAIRADFIVLASGVVPETRLAREAGLALGPTGAIKVDASMRTSDPSIFAVGDAVEVTQLVTGQPARIPLAGPANRQGRVAADAIAGRASRYTATQGTSIIKVFDLVLAATGASSSLLRAEDIPFKKAIVHAESHAGYYPGSATIHLSLLYSPSDGLILGAQAAGADGVDKRIDVLATAIRHRATVFDLADYELAYAPPFGSAKDPVNLVGFVAANDLEGLAPLITADALPSNASLLDVRTLEEVEQGAIPGAVTIPLDELRQRIAEVPRDRPLVVYCAVGKRAYFAQRILAQHGHSALNLTGGYTTYAMSVLDRTI